MYKTSKAKTISSKASSGNYVQNSRTTRKLIDLSKNAKDSKWGDPPNKHQNIFWIFLEHSRFLSESPFVLNPPWKKQEESFNLGRYSPSGLRSPQLRGWPQTLGAFVPRWGAQHLPANGCWGASGVRSGRTFQKKRPELATGFCHPWRKLPKHHNCW